MQKQASAIAILSSIILLIPLATAQTSVRIVVKGDSVESMEPSDLYSATPYAVNVKVMDDKGNPKAGSNFELRTAGGAVSIDGASSATTRSDGVATLSLTFTAGGIVRLYVDGTRLKTINVLYNSPPTGALAVIAVLFLVLVVAVGYTAYVGPLKWARTK
jgi:hypothetical protein